MSFLEHRKFESRKYILLITVPTIVLHIFFKSEIQQVSLNQYIYFSLYFCDYGETDIYIFKIEPEKKYMSSSSRKFSYYDRMMPSISLFLFFLQTPLWVIGRQDGLHCKEVIAL